ncbi:MAG: NTP transferase domain-containing protein [Planctomycetota bacterium]|nr:NTP transferase domain-containing protein [Planctomycetota bacterium]
MRVGGVLLGGGRSRRFGANKLEARLDGERLLDRACRHFLEAGLDPVVFVGAARPADARVLQAEPGAEMIDTLRAGLALLPDVPFAFAPADLPFLTPALIAELKEAFLASGRAFLVPSYGRRRGHPAFAREKRAFLKCTTARDVWREAGDELVHHAVETADVLFDVDTPEDLAAASDPERRLRRLVDRGDLVG